MFVVGRSIIGYVWAVASGWPANPPVAESEKQPILKTTKLKPSLKANPTVRPQISKQLRQQANSMVGADKRIADKINKIVECLTVIVVHKSPQIKFVSDKQGSVELLYNVHWSGNVMQYMTW